MFNGCFYTNDKLLNVLDDWISGPFNLIDRVERLITGAKYNDPGYQMAIPRIDKGGEFTLDEAERLLNRYEIAIYGRRHDAKNMYFCIKNRQARWAEYLLLHAGFKLINRTYDECNPDYVAQHESGWMPRHEQIETIDSR